MLQPVSQTPSPYACYTHDLQFVPRFADATLLQDFDAAVHAATTDTTPHHHVSHAGFSSVNPSPFTLRAFLDHQSDVPKSRRSAFKHGYPIGRRTSLVSKTTAFLDPKAGLYKAVSKRKQTVNQGIWSSACSFAVRETIFLD